MLFQIHEYFGSMDKSMLTLLIMGTILDDVTECSETCLQRLIQNLKFEFAKLIL